MNDNQLEELQTLKRERALRLFLEGNRDLLAPADAATLLAGEVSSGQDGNIDIASAQTALARLRQRSPFLFRSGRADHGMDTQGVPPPRPLTDVEKAAQIFGKNASAKKANALAMSNKAEYQRLRQVARDNEIL
jgi:hypothetical protein